MCEKKYRKEEKCRVRFTVGGNLINYPGVVATPTAELQTVKFHLNSVVSDVAASYMTAGVKTIYLNTPLNSYEYICIPVNVISVDIMEQYNLSPLVVNSFILVEIRKGMYGLPQAGIIANN